jgi:acetolactate synthase-1/3 small subunit
MSVAMNHEPPTTHNLYILLQDRPGALHRVITLLRRRNYNIASMHVERSEMAGVSRMNVAIEAASAETLAKELERIIDVLAVRRVINDRWPDARLLVSTRVQADGLCDVEELQ